MTEICLVRHGETEWNQLGKLQGRTDTELDDNGIQQAKECAKALSGQQWSAIVTSPLRRAYRTAELIQEQLQIPLLEMEDFIERSFGTAEGMTVEERLTAYPDRIYPQQETEAHLEQRLRAALNKLQAEYPQGQVIVVSHGAVINYLLRTMCMHDMEIPRHSLVNGSMSTITLRDGAWHVQDFNMTHHLSHYKEIGKM
ncbi:histidine phosphatase family protein [Staphylococcus pettenkoferi]|uniref:histidine phosphatase family protein n=1 Tax=Staphylococcus pettenkoferi TaxID=170573 RepID=UPI00066B8267|nr:histidine phosphatase family protein [Staphylococcus pettenkoferi]MCY1574907.1 histidine phosphatase family protein [Staphylococcus pettenkoferi]MCY1578436.1 histidine phosphatase family protein [Staphylococcus pettenkoferi]MCY1586184.1 histidine phosphatase family protein [Staphylococcus pettenkoferi]PNZ91015.1 histidine phosphatase family protein [Staphylococcus pettenkoferi]QQC36596.1 histidine phosphatase family protein [Staphylococcus pettenkoferi]